MARSTSASAPTITQSAKGRLARKILAGTLCFCLVYLISYFQYKAGYRVTFSIFYLVPIFFTAVLVSLPAAIVIAVLGAISFPAVDILSGRHFSDLFISWWNAAARFGIYFCCLMAFRLWEREKQLARTDPLTGAANRRSLYESLSIEIDRSRRYKHPLSIAYLDCDNFKKINDDLGHQTGDRLLKKTTDCLLMNTRSMDVTARLGGDEFVLIFPETGPAGAEAAAKKVHQKLSELMAQNQWPVTFSLGAVTFLEAPSSLEAAINKADELMYSAKQSGKNSVKTCVTGN